MAYNEEANIGKMLEAVLSQRLDQVEIAEIIVVASGCTDRTEDVVELFAREDPRIRLVTQPCRSGKSAAVNLLLQQNEQEIIALVNADTIPAPDAIENLIAPFADPKVGMTGGRPVPTNDRRTFLGYAAHLLWSLHHEVSLRRPKMGEIIAFRNFFRQIPPDSAVDEASIEPLIRGQGLEILYVPEAIVYNCGPGTVEDFLRQRRRIFAGHTYVRETLGYRVSTMKGIRILWLLLTASTIKRDWRYFCWTPAVVALEIWGRLRGALDYRIWKRKHSVWEVVETTKVISSVAPADSSGLPGS
jgi:cellulose synthase/poly-beta-1,6-N-acetylglucosamine synthase-like glycosyltransferase